MTYKKLKEKIMDKVFNSKEWKYWAKLRERKRKFDAQMIFLYPNEKQVNWDNFDDLALSVAWDEVNKLIGRLEQKEQDAEDFANAWRKK